MNDRSTLDDGRRLFVWRSANDASRLADALAEAGVTELFNMGELVWLQRGQAIPVNSRAMMLEIVTKFIAGVRLADHGEFGPGVEYYSYEFPPGADTSKQPDQTILLSLIELLVDRVAKGPVAPRILSEHQTQAIKMRRAEGEPLADLALAYGIEIEQVRSLVSR